jgi:hypothetical protein
MSGSWPNTVGDGRDRRELVNDHHMGRKARRGMVSIGMQVGPEARFVRVSVKPIGGVGESRTRCLMKFFLHRGGVEFRKSSMSLPPKL